MRKIEAEHVRQGVWYRQGEDGVHQNFSGGLYPSVVEQGYCVVQGKGKKVFSVQVKQEKRISFIGDKYRFKRRIINPFPKTGQAVTTYGD